jgi:hypothetical protein
MLSIIPILSLGCLFVWVNKANPTWGWRRSWLRSIVIWGIWIIITTELLSLFHWVTLAGLGLTWTAFFVICLIGIYRHKKSTFQVKLDQQIFSNWYLLLPILLIFLITGLVAWLAAPETADSLNYHMPRVAHWAQNRSVEHFSTGIEQQNSRPAFAEYAIMQLYVLGQGDRLANFVEWLAMVSSVIGVSLLAALLGAPLAGQLLAALFVASLPMGIVQASSTMNDYVVGLWLVCVAEVFLSAWLEPKKVTMKEIFFLASAAGLAIATKSIAFAYLLPFALATAILLFRIGPPIKTIRFIIVAILICSALNAGMMARNIYTYGTLIDPGQALIHANKLLDWRGLVSNLLRNAGLQASTPWESVNYQLSRLIQGIHFKMGVALDDPRTTAHGEFWVRPLSFTVAENTAPNPLHAYLIFLFTIIAIIRYKKVNFINAAFLVLVIATFIVFSYVFKWQIFGSRYQLPYFVLFGVAFGSLFFTVIPKWTAYLLAVMLTLSAVWPLLGNENRPLIPLLEKTNINNALSATHNEIDYFGIVPGNNPYRQIANIIQEQNCQEVLLMLGGNSPEYYWWMALGAPKSKVQINWLVGGSPSSVYENISPSSCAVICEDCSTQNYVHDMPKVYSYGNFDLYMLVKKQLQN